VDLTRQNPTINPAYFPDTIASSYYSSTTHVSEVDTPWTMHFQYGMDSGFYKTSPTYIRAVRRGQSVGLGDLDGDGNTSLTDAIRGLQITVGFKSPDSDVRVDVNGDGKIGMAEVVYILQKAAWLRRRISCFATGNQRPHLTT